MQRESWMRKGENMSAMGLLGVYIMRPSYSKGMGLLAAGTALLLAGGHPLLWTSAFTAGAASLAATLGRELDEWRKRLLVGRRRNRRSSASPSRSRPKNERRMIDGEYALGSDRERGSTTSRSKPSGITTRVAPGDRPSASARPHR